MRSLAAAAALMSLVLIGRSSFATTPYPNFDEPNVSVTGIKETSTFGDPEPISGAPTRSGNSLLFFPASFTASPPAANGLRQAGAQLQATILATSFTTVDLPITPLVIGLDAGDLQNSSFNPDTLGTTAPR